MPPLVLQVVVDKDGVMRKTTTVLVTRYTEHPLTHKVRLCFLLAVFLFDLVVEVSAFIKLRDLCPREAHH